MSARRAFTLMELLVVLAILALVTTVVGACLATGIKVWSQVQDFNIMHSQAVLGLERFEKDFSNGFPGMAGPFSGGPTDVTFPVAAGFPAAADGTNGLRTRLGTLTYMFDATSGTLYRRAEPFPASVRPEESARAERVASDLLSFGLEYRAAAGDWTTTWTSVSNFPAALRLTMTLRRDGQRMKINKTLVRWPQDGNNIETK